MSEAIFQGLLELPFSAGIGWFQIDGKFGREKVTEIGDIALEDVGGYFGGCLRLGTVTGLLGGRLNCKQFIAHIVMNLLSPQYKSKKCYL